MEVIVLQHIKIEDPGYIKDLMLADGWKLTTIELDQGDKIPNDLNKFDAMFCMGGPMDTWMEEKYPWLIEEKKRIKEFVVDKKKPFLGFCLGCQLLGEVVGGKVIKSNPAEIGIMNVDFLKKKQVAQLGRIVDELDIAVLAFGIRTDFQGELFEGSKYLLAWADNLKEIKTVCWCGRKATMVVRLDSKGNILSEGQQLEIGGNEKYIPLCRAHFNKKDLGN